MTEKTTEFIMFNYKHSYDLFQSVSSNGLYVYTSLKYLCYNQHRVKHWVSLNSINRVLKPNSSIINSKQKEDITNGIMELSNLGIITIIDKYKDNEFYIDSTNIFQSSYSQEIETPFGEYETVKQKDYFSMIFLKDLRIMYSEVNYRKEFFRYLFYIMGQRSKNTYFIKSRSAIAREIKSSKNTIIKYNEILVRYNILYIIQANYRWKKDNGDIINLSNIYGLLKDKEYIDTSYDNFIKEHIKELEKINYEREEF